MASGNVNLAQKIGTDYMKLGIFLLKDDNADLTIALEKEHHGNAEHINMAVFRQWVKGNGLNPVTWATLVHVLHEIGQGALAEDVQQAKCCNG
jgi:hypothetical protein